MDHLWEVRLACETRVHLSKHHHNIHTDHRLSPVDYYHTVAV